MTRTAPPEDGFAGLPAKKLRALANRVLKIKVRYKIDDALREAVDGAVSPQALALHLLAAGHLDPLRSGAMLEYLSWCAFDGPAASGLAEALARRDESGATDMVRASSLDWMAGWPAELDAAVYRAFGVSPEAFAERAARYAPATRRGLAFVARRHNRPAPTEDVEGVLVALADAQATGYGIATNADCPFVDDDGREVAHSVSGLPALRALALRVGPAGVWDRALVAAARRNAWGLLENVTDALVALPLDELTGLFASRPSPFGDSSDADAHVAALLDRRDDPAEALLAPLACEPVNSYSAAQLRATYAAAAERRRAREGVR